MYLWPWLVHVCDSSLQSVAIEFQVRLSRSSSNSDPSIPCLTCVPLSDSHIDRPIIRLLFGRCLTLMQSFQLMIVQKLGDVSKHLGHGSFLMVSIQKVGI